jgi:predicted RNase H-like HicB family nuclease
LISIPASQYWHGVAFTEHCDKIVSIIIGTTGSFPEAKMFFTICVRRDGANNYKAIVPDLPGCTTTSVSKARALTDIHLAIETRIAELLGNEKTMPLPRPIEELQLDKEFAEGELFAIHINLDHLRAVAVHQADHWE